MLRDLKMGMVVLSGAKTWLDVLVMARGRGRMGVWEGGPEGNVEEKEQTRLLYLETSLCPWAVVSALL